MLLSCRASAEAQQEHLTAVHRDQTDQISEDYNHDEAGNEYYKMDKTCALQGQAHQWAAAGGTHSPGRRLESRGRALPRAPRVARAARDERMVLRAHVAHVVMRVQHAHVRRAQ